MPERASSVASGQPQDITDLAIKPGRTRLRRWLRGTASVVVLAAILSITDLMAGGSHGDRLGSPEVATATSFRSIERDSWGHRESRASAAPIEGPQSGPADRFEIGDKVKIVLYERVDDVEKDKWGRRSAALQGFQQRPEFSGEYTIKDDGTIALPLLGSFVANELSPSDLQAALERSFQTLTNRKALVTILSLERPPVYVLGPVKTPGSYRYVLGMTVLHTIALAGGFDRQNLEGWQQIDAVREIERRRGAIENLLKVLARTDVLKAERDGTPVEPSVRLVQLAGDAEAKRLIAIETARRASIVAARQSQERAAAVSMAAAKEEVNLLSNRLRPIDDLIGLRQRRVDAMQLLLQHGSISNLVMVQAQSELSDAQQRRQDAVNQYALAEQRAALTQQDKAKWQVDRTTGLETEILAAEQQAEASERELSASEGVLTALHVSPIHPLSPIQTVSDSPPADYAYEIIRQHATGPVAQRGNGMTVLQPGDLVRVIPKVERGPMNNSSAAGTASSNAATAPAPVPASLAAPPPNPR